VEADTFKLPKAHVYLTNFYINQLVNQIDFGFLNSSYQAFTGGAVYFNPGGNLLFKVGAIDLFEDYKLTAGFRFSGNFDSNEYLLSLDDYKTRLDKQYIFHRQTFMSEVARNPAPIFLQVNTSEAMYVLKYPFSQVNALKATFTLRFDKTFYKSTELRTLFTSTEYKTWAGIKLEYIFDNTTNKGINLYNGSRYKLFGEFYKQLDGKNTDLFVVGADFRHYQKIHRQVIFASRFAASTSFGRSRLIYYLGGVDNWTNLSRDVQTFIPLDEVPINRNHNYVYQTVATNMRGFPQNVRNGNSFIVINNELRIPVFRYLLNRPINSDFLNNFQIIGFGDIGTAWSGATPYSKENAYNSLVVENGSITVTIDQDKPPFVAGYGFGVRSRLLGYFVRLDWAWGIEDNAILPRIFYLSLDLDF